MNLLHIYKFHNINISIFKLLNLFKNRYIRYMMAQQSVAIASNIYNSVSNVVSQVWKVLIL